MFYYNENYEYGVILVELKTPFWENFVFPKKQELLVEKNNKVMIIFDREDYIYDSFENPNFSFSVDYVYGNNNWNHFFYKNFEVNDSPTRKYTLFPPSTTYDGIIYKINYTTTFLDYTEKKYVQGSVYNNVFCNEEGERVFCIRKQYTGQNHMQYTFEYKKSEFYRDEIAYILYQYLVNYKK
jgi:hypothetical protein